MMSWTAEIFFSESRINGFSNSTFCDLVSVMKYGETNPRSNRIPSVTSSSSSMVFPSFTVMTPSFPTFSMALAISLPMCVSPFALIVATCAISSLVVMSRLFFCRNSTTASTAAWVPRRRSIGLHPAATFLTVSEKIARARTVAVVVPSPAVSFVFEATSWMSRAPRFSNLSLRVMALATVTPSAEPSASVL